MSQIFIEKMTSGRCHSRMLMRTPNSIFDEAGILNYVYLHASIKGFKLVASQQKAWKPCVKQSTVAYVNGGK